MLLICHLEVTCISITEDTYTSFATVDTQQLVLWFMLRFVLLSVEDLYDSGMSSSSSKTECDC